MERWVLAAVWATLPLTAGGALADATAGWSGAPRLTAAVLAWGAWALTLLAIAVPRPAGLTAARTVAPCFAALAIVVAVGADVERATATVAAVAALVAAALVTRPALACAAADAVAYGYERRYPLRVPPALFLGPLPAVRALVAAAVALGPLLLAAGRWLPGVVAVVVGVPVVVLGGRALHALSSRWAVLVPAGFVVVDPLTLADPVLFPRERITALAPVTADAAGAADTLDLRLGATLGSISLVLDRPAEVFRAVRARRGATAVRTTEIRVAAVHREALLAEAAGRRIPVIVAPGDARAPRARKEPGPPGTGDGAGDGAGDRAGDQDATPPPTSSSPS